MNAEQIINMDFAADVPMERVVAVEGDSGTRTVMVRLSQNGSKWQIPGDVTASLAYEKADGTSGWYDTLPDGASACSVQEEQVRITLAPQILAEPGLVRAALILEQGERRLSTFGFWIDVKNSPAGGEKSEDYYNLKVVASVEALEKRMDTMEKTGGGSVKTVNGASPDENGNVVVKAATDAQVTAAVDAWLSMNLTDVSEVGA